MSYPKKCVIIDIGHEQIKILDTVRVKDTLKIEKAIRIPTPPFSVDDGILLNIEEIAGAIRKAFTEEKIKCKDIVFTIASSKIITREVNFPDLKRKKLKALVDMNASEYFPVNLDDYVVDFTVIEHLDFQGEKSVNASIMAALTTLVAEYVRLAELCQLKIVGIDYAGNSLVNLIQQEKMEGTNIVLDLGKQSSMVAIVENGVMKFNRNLLYGTKELIDAIANHFEIPYEEALVLSVERPLITLSKEDNPYLKSELTDALDELLNGITRLIDYYSSRNNGKFNYIYIVGGGTTINGIEEYIEHYFSTPTQKLKEFKCINTASTVKFTGDEIYFINAMGAAFSEVNLLPKHLASKTEAKVKLKYELLAVAFIVVIMVAMSFIKYQAIKNIEREQEEVAAKIVEGKRVLEIKNEKIALENKVLFRKKIDEVSRSTSEDFVETLETMEETMPSNLIIKSIVDSGDGIVMTGVAIDKLTVAKFIEILRDMNFSDVYIPNTNEIEYEVIDVDIVKDSKVSATANSNTSTNNDRSERILMVDFTVNCTY